MLRDVELDTAQRRVLAAFAAHLGVLREREELARQTAAARELEAGNRTRTALLAAVSHDLRTPLAGLRAAASTLRRHDAATFWPPTGRTCWRRSKSTLRLSRMVADLLDMSRLQTGAVEPVLTTTPVLDIVTAALARAGGTATGCGLTAVAEVTADLGLLARVIVNLVGNGLRHTDGPVEVTGHADGARACVLIVDHGPGVPVEERDRLFQPFQRLGDQRSSDGVGLAWPWPGVWSRRRAVRCAPRRPPAVV